MQRVGEDVFARARLAQKHDRQIALGHEIDDAVKLPHPVVGDDDRRLVRASRRHRPTRCDDGDGGLERAVDHEDRGADDHDLPALDGHARVLGDAHAAHGGSVGAAQIFHLDRATAVKSDVLARDRAVIDGEVAAPRAADGEFAAVGELFCDRAAGPHGDDMWAPRIEGRVFLRAGELVFARSHLRVGRVRRRSVAPA